jgi:hypothetical protein
MKGLSERPAYRVSSALSAADKPALEKLFFFNDNQARLRETVERAVEKYGVPEIIKCEGKLRLILPRIENAQTLYLRTNDLSPSLIGLVVYVREDRSMKILYWALRPDYSSRSNTRKYLLLEIVEMLKAVGRRIVGIDSIAFEFGSREFKLRI